MSFDRRLFLGTDVAHFFLFDPELLDYAAAWPIDWYDAPPVWQHVSRAEHLVAWSTRGDGVYAIRLTTDGLTEAEKSQAGPSWTFPLASTGRVLIDGGDLLPSEDRFTGDTPRDEQWINLAEGPWHVTVTALEWSAADMPEEEAAKLFPNYVVSFCPAKEASSPQIARRPPDLLCLRTATANDALPHPVVRPAQTEDGPDLSLAMPMPAGLSVNVVPVPGHFTSEGESDLLMSITPDMSTFDAFDLPCFMAPNIEVGAIGQVCTLTGSGGTPGKPPRFSLTARMTARVAEITGRLHEGRLVPLKKKWIFGGKPPPLGDYAAPLLQVRVQAVVPDMTPPRDLPLEAFRAALLTSLSDGALAAAFGGRALFHHIQLSACDNYPQLVGFALCYLPMAATGRAELTAMDFAQRVRVLSDQLADA